MKRDLGVERLYPLGDFKNIKFSTILKDIPDELAQNEVVISKLFLLETISCEQAYREYFALVDRIAKEKIQDVLAYLQEQRVQTMKELQEEIQKVVDENKKLPEEAQDKPE